MYDALDFSTDRDDAGGQTRESLSRIASPSAAVARLDPDHFAHPIRHPRQGLRLVARSNRASERKAISGGGATMNTQTKTQQTSNAQPRKKETGQAVQQPTSNSEQRQESNDEGASKDCRACRTAHRRESSTALAFTGGDDRNKTDQPSSRLLRKSSRAGGAGSEKEIPRGTGRQSPGSQIRPEIFSPCFEATTQAAFWKAGRGPREEARRLPHKKSAQSAKHNKPKTVSGT